MSDLLPPFLVVAAAIIWLAGLRLFLHSGLSRRRKILWTAFLVSVGAAIGLLLTGRQVLEKFLILLALLPVLASIDVVLMRSGRGLSFWIRACGFEVTTVFAVARFTRLLCDRAGLAAFLGVR